MTTHHDTTDRDAVAALARAWDEPPDADAPWVPEGAWVPRVGDRVRINIVECRAAPEPGSPQAMRGTLRGHDVEEQGMTGTVEATTEVRVYAHPYLVRWDRPIAPDVRSVGSAYALGELVPLAADDGGEGR